MKRPAIALLLVVTLASACSTTRLRVNVDVYKGPLATLNADSLALAKSVVASPLFSPEGRMDVYRDIEGQVGSMVRQETVAALSGLLGKAAATVTADTLWRAKDGKAGIGVRLDEEWAGVGAKAQETYKSAVQLLFEAEPNGLESMDESLQARLRDNFAATVQQFDLFRKQTEDAIADGLEGKVTEAAIKQIVEQAGLLLTFPPVDVDRFIAASADVQGRAVGYPLFDSRVASVIGHENDWIPFMSANFKAEGGNAQFVVVREGLVVFRQKSLDFDPTPIVGAGTALSKLGLKVAAAASSGLVPGNVPGLPSATGDGDSKPATVDQPTFLVNNAETEANKNTLQHRLEAKIQLLTRLADLLDRAEKAKNDEDELQKIRKEVEIAVGFYLGSVAEPVED